MSINFLFLQSGLVFVVGMGLRVQHSLFAVWLGADTSTIGLMLAVSAGATLLISWPMGRMVDRHGPRWYMIGTALIGTLGMLVPAVFPSIAALFVASFMMGVATAGANVIGQILVGVLSRPGELAKNFANYSVVAAVVAVIGPAFAGFSIDHTGFRETSFNLAVIMAVATVMITLHPCNIPPTRAPGTAHGGLRETLRDRRVMRIVVLSCLVHTGIDVFQSFLPILGHNLGLSASVIGGVMAAYSVATFVSRVLLQWLIEKMGLAGLLTAAHAVGSVGAVLIALSPNALMLSVACFVFGLGMGCGFPVTTMMMHESVGKEGRVGEALGLRQTAYGVVRTAGPTLFGSIGALLGVGVLFGIVALVVGYGAYLLRVRRWCSGDTVERI